MPQTMKNISISQETKITLSIAVALLSGAFYISNLEARTSTAMSLALKNEARIEALTGKIETMLINQERANTKLDMLLEKKK